MLNQYPVVIRRSCVAVSPMVSNARPNSATSHHPGTMTAKFRNHLRSLACAACVLLLISVAVSAQAPLRIKYWLAMPHPTTHLFEVTIEVELPDDPSLTSLDFQMPNGRPAATPCSTLRRMFKR